MSALHLQKESRLNTFLTLSWTTRTPSLSTKNSFTHLKIVYPQVFYSILITGHSAGLDTFVSTSLHFGHCFQIMAPIAHVKQPLIISRVRIDSYVIVNSVTGKLFAIEGADMLPPGFRRLDVRYDGKGWGASCAKASRAGG